MANSKKFTITATKADASNFSLTISNPKNGIQKANVDAFLQNYSNVYEDDLTLKTAKYIETSETAVYPILDA